MKLWPFGKNGTHPRGGSGFQHPASGSRRFSRPPRPSVFFQRNYDAASSDRLLNDWTSTTDGDGWTKLGVAGGQGATLRDRARDLERNSDLVSRYVQLVLSNVVGPRGIRYQADVKQENGEPDTGANEILEASFAHWSVADFCSHDGRLAWPELQAMLLRRLMVDGEVFLRLVRGADNPWGFALEALDADLCDEEKNQEAGEGRPRIENGVEMDAARRPIAYHFFAGPTATHSQKHVRIPADTIIHLYMPRRTRDVRGITPLAPVMRSIRMLDGYNYAKVVAARVAAAKMGFFTTDDGSYTGDGELSDGATKMSAEPGEFEVAPDGMNFVGWDPSWPRDDDAFVKGIKRSIAAGLGVSYVSLASDLEGVNYSSIRQGELEQRDLYRSLHRMLVRRVHRRVHYQWLLMAMTSGQIKLPFEKLAKFRGARFQPRGWQWVDPLKEINAQTQAHTLGVKSLTQIVAEQGEDLEEVFQQIQRDTALAEKYGITIGGSAQSAPPDKPDDKETDDE